MNNAFVIALYYETQNIFLEVITGISPKIFKFEIITRMKNIHPRNFYLLFLRVKI